MVWSQSLRLCVDPPWCGIAWCGIALAVSLAAVSVLFLILGKLLGSPRALPHVFHEWLYRARGSQRAG